MGLFSWFRRRPAEVAPSEPTKLPVQPAYGPEVTRQAPTPPPADKTPKSLTTADGTTRIVLQRFPAQHRAILLPLALAVVEADKQLPAGMVQRVVLDTLVALASQKRRAGGCCGGKCRRTVPKRENPPA